MPTVRLGRGHSDMSLRVCFLLVQGLFANTITSLWKQEYNDFVKDRLPLALTKYLATLSNKTRTSFFTMRLLNNQELITVRVFLDVNFPFAAFQFQQPHRHRTIS